MIVIVNVIVIVIANVNVDFVELELAAREHARNRVFDKVRKMELA